MDKSNQYDWKIEKRIQKAFSEQYEGASIEEFDKKRIIPILDDFHFAKNREKHIRDLSAYQNQVIIVDDIFTNGNTANNICKLLKKYGAKKITVICLGYTDHNYYYN